MVHRSVHLAWVVCLIASALWAFLALRALDEGGVLAPGHQIWAQEVSPEASAPEVIDALERFAETSGAEVVKFASDPHDPVGARHLYIAGAGGVGERWLVDGYPDFSADIRTTVHPVHELPASSLGGYYLVLGSEGAASGLHGALARLGLSGPMAPHPGLPVVLALVAYGPMLWCFVLAALGVVVLVGCGVLLNAKAYGIVRLHGHSLLRILLRDLGWLLPRAALATVAVTTVSIPALTLYNGARRLLDFCALAAELFAVLAAVAVATHVLALAMVHRAPLVRAIKGELPVGVSLSAAYAIRLPALLIATAVVFSAVQGMQLVLARERARPLWASAGQAVYPMLNGSVTGQRDALDARTGAMIRQADAAGEVVLAVVLDAGTVCQAAACIGRQLLVVNDGYLLQQQVVDADGVRIQPSSAPRLLLPPELQPLADRIREGARSWLGHASRGASTQEALPLAAVPLAERPLFSYGSVFDARAPSQLLGPIVLALPAASRLLSDDSLAAHASTGGVVFIDPSTALARVEASGLGAYVITLNPVAQNAAQQHRALLREFRLQLANVASALSVVFLSALAVAIVYTRRSAQAIFVRHVSGWSFIRTHRLLLLIEVSLALVMTGWTALQTAGALAASGRPEAGLLGRTLALGGAEPLATAGVALASLVLLAAAVAAMTGRLIRSRSADA